MFHGVRVTLGAHQTTLTRSSFLSCLFSFSLHAFSPMCFLWMSAGMELRPIIHVSTRCLCLCSNPSPRIRPFFFSLKAVMGLTCRNGRIFPPHVYIHTDQIPSISVPFFKCTFFPWLRNIKRNVSMRHCELVVIPYLASPIANIKWCWVKRGGVE